MPLDPTYRGSNLISPVRIRPAKNPAGFVTDANVKVVCTPTQIIKQTFTNASTIDPDGISASHAGAGAAGTTSMTIGGALASGGVATLTPARNVVITVTHGSAVVAMNGVITGTRFGRVLTETWSVTAGTTSKTYTGSKAFDTITGITEIVAADASANTIVAGDGKKLGLNFKNSATTAVKELEDGAAPTAGVLVAGVAGSATADPRGTYAPNSTLNGALDFDVWYLCDDLEDIY